MNINDFPHASLKQRSDIEGTLSKIRDISSLLNRSATEELKLRNLRRATGDALDAQIEYTANLDLEKTKLLNELSDMYQNAYKQELASTATIEAHNIQRLKDSMDE